jgi:hypothetical protein
MAACGGCFLVIRFCEQSRATADPALFTPANRRVWWLSLCPLWLWVAARGGWSRLGYFYAFKEKGPACCGGVSRVPAGVALSLGKRFSQCLARICAGLVKRPRGCLKQTKGQGRTKRGEAWSRLGEEREQSAARLGRDWARREKQSAAGLGSDETKRENDVRRLR